MKTSPHPKMQKQKENNCRKEIYRTKNNYLRKGIVETISIGINIVPDNILLINL